MKFAGTIPIHSLVPSIRHLCVENAAVHVANFNAGNTLSFTNVTPSEGTGGYKVATNTNVYCNFSNNFAIQAPLTGILTSFIPPTPTLQSGVQNGSVRGTIAISNASAYDHASLVITRFANIVTSQDVSSVLTSNAAYTITNLAAGSSTGAQPGAYYYGYLRLWKSGLHKAAKIVPIPGFIDLRNTNSVTGFNVSVSGS